jgi:ureidoglycolate lyase
MDSPQAFASNRGETIVKTVNVQELSVEAFLPFGTFVSHLDPGASKSSGRPVAFIPDMLQLNLGGHSIASFSTCRVEKREAVIGFSEYHTSCGEGIVPLDNDILIHVGPPTSARVGLPVDQIQVFRVPQGTAVSLRPGVWHGAPFAATDQPSNVLIVLPERTYANDCVVVLHEEEQKIEIVGG